MQKNGALFTNSHGVAHPSQPNYLAIFSGSTQGVTDNNRHPKFNSKNLASQLINAKKSLIYYSEELPSTGFDGNQYKQYVRRHNASTQFINLGPQVNQPLRNFPTNFDKLPSVAFIVPNLCNDAHDCSLKVADNWLLLRNINKYAEWAKNNNSLLIITFDESLDDPTNNNIPTIFYGAHVKVGRYSNFINHYNILATIEWSFNLPLLRNTAPIRNVWK